MAKSTRAASATPRRKSSAAVKLAEPFKPGDATSPGEVVTQVLEQLHDSVEQTMDPLGMAAPIAHAQIAWMTHPQELSRRMLRLSTDLWNLQWHTLNRLMGIPSEDPIKVNDEDVRFADPIWTESPSWDLLKEWYLAFTHHTQDMLYDTPGLATRERRKAAFWWRNWLNAMAPVELPADQPCRHAARHGDQR
jgi:polyhydroxyalkanoate synthase